jgi:ABC-type nitrate/sulfonate/bicarbonate transport system ATPase subunit
MITHDEDLAKTFADVIVRMAPRRGESVGEMVEVIKNSPGVEAKVSQDLEVAVVSNQGEIQ